MDVEQVTDFLMGLSPRWLLIMGMPVWWLRLTAGYPANTCLDSALILRQAYAMFEEPAKPICVRLRVEDTVSGQTHLLGTDTPHCQGDQLIGHVGLWLPTAGVFIDQTVQQFSIVGHEDWMPVMIATRSGGGPRAGLGCLRGRLRLAYTPVLEPVNTAVFAHPTIRAATRNHRRTGINLASSMLGLLRQPEYRERALATPHPRLRQLLRHIGDAHATVDADHDMRFMIPGTAPTSTTSPTGDHRTDPPAAFTTLGRHLRISTKICPEMWMTAIR